MPTLLGETRDRSGSISEQNDSAVYTETIEYLVKADSKEQSRDVILTTPGLPKVKQTVTSNGLAYCKSINAKTDPINPLYWHVTAEFSTPEPGKEANSGSPLDFRPLASFTFELIDEVSMVDATGNPVVNSAGQTFDTGFVIKRPITHVSFTQYELATLTLAQIIARNGVTNASTFVPLGAGANQLLLGVESAEIGTFFDLYCWRIRYKLSHKFGGWKVQRLDRGVSYKDGSSGLLPYTDKKGNRVVGNLNGSGLKTGNEGQDPAAVLQFAVYGTSDFSFIRL